MRFPSLAKSGDATKKQILSIRSSELRKSKLPDKTPLHGLIDFYITHKTECGNSPLYRLLKDLGYADRLKISEQEFIKASNKKRAQPIESKRVRFCVFNAYLNENFGSSIENVSREQVLSIPVKKCMKYKLKTYQKATLLSLFSFWRANGRESGRTDASPFYLILLETGIAKRLNITEEDLKIGVADRRAKAHKKELPRLKIKNSLDAHLEKLFGSDITADNLKTLRTGIHFRDDHTRPGPGLFSPNELFWIYDTMNRNQVKNKQPHVHRIFLMLKDNGYAERFSLVESDFTKNNRGTNRSYFAQSIAPPLPANRESEKTETAIELMSKHSQAWKNLACVDGRRLAPPAHAPNGGRQFVNAPKKTSIGIA
jgi:hypothetical protein